MSFSKCRKFNGKTLLGHDVASCQVLAKKGKYLITHYLNVENCNT